MFNKSTVHSPQSTVGRFLSSVVCRPSTAWRSQAGFTLVEVIVMITIVTVGVLSTLAVAHATIQASNSNAKRVAATNLAREGIEMVHAIRDSNWAAHAQGGLDCWDWYPTTAALATAVQGSGYTSTCDPKLSNLTAETNFRPVFAVSSDGSTLANGMPYLEQPNGSSVTSDPVYLLCPSATLTIYQPKAGGLPCPNNGTPFYRRVTVQRGKDLGSGRYNIKVRAFVTWPERVKNNQPDIILEEYLTDWKKFS